MKIKHFDVLSGLLKYYELPFEVWKPNSQITLPELEMSFGRNCRFQDVYLLAHILKDYGLEYIYPSRKSVNEIRLGTYLRKMGNPIDFAFGMPVKINEFLEIDPKRETLTVIQNTFMNGELIAIENDGLDEETDDNCHEGNYEEEYDWERETFDAMTDGQLGEWDDFNGDIDDVMTWAGRD